MTLLLLILAMLILVAVLIGRGSYNPSYEHKLINKALDNAGVPQKKRGDCLRWAFGEDALSILISEMDDRWRQRHSDIFMLIGSDPLYESTIRIGKAYLERMTS